MNPTLYLVTNSDNLNETDFLNTITLACQGGITLLQLREKNLSTREYLNLALKVKSITKKYNIPLIIDDRIDVAMAANTEGVHLGQTDLPIAAARTLMGQNKIIGATAKTVPQAIDAESQGANYLGVGAIYPTKTKVITVLTPVETLAEITAAVKIPAIAIGGLDSTNLDILKGSGASGIAVVRAIMESPNPKEETEKLLALATEISTHPRKDGTYTTTTAFSIENDGVILNRKSPHA